MIPVYRTNPYLFTIETIADAVSEEGETQLVTCRELIFVEGGGQPRDYGTITFNGVSSQVSELVKGKGDVRLRIEKIEGLEKGVKIVASIDGKRRSAIMRLHTLQHALAGGLRSILPDYQTGGMQISEDAKECSMRFISADFNGAEDLKRGIQVVEKAIADDLQVSAEVFDNLDAVKAKFGELYRPSDPKVQIKGKVRIVTIAGLDVNACGGTHLKSLAEAKDIQVKLKQYDSTTGEGNVAIT